MKKIFNIIAGIVFGCIIVALGVYNYQNNKSFFEASFTSLATICVAVIVSFYLVQLKTDKRRQKEKIDTLLYKIQSYLTEESFLLGGEDAWKNLILHRSIFNKIKYLENLNIDKKILDELKKVKGYLEKFRCTYSENYLDEEKLKDKYDELKHYITLIDDICDKIHILLS